MASAADARRSRAGVRRAAGGLLALVVVAAPATAQTRLTPRLGAEVTWTDNVNLQPNADRRSDFVFVVTPSLGVDVKTARLTLEGNIALPVSFYARGEAENRVAPSVDLNGSFALVRDLVRIEARATVTQTYYSPFGPQPSGVVLRPDNQYTQQVYSVSPVLEGRTGGNVDYLLRLDNIWTMQSGEPVALRDTYTNRIVGRVDRAPTPLGAGADFERTDYRIDGRDNSETTLARVRGVWRASEQLEVFASGGYERNRLGFVNEDGPIYGAGFRWRPTSRTSLEARYEERFFGASYDVAFDHRTPLTVWNVRASRDITTFPERIAALPAGAFVPGLLNELLRSRFPDPVARQQFIDGLMADRGLPLTLTEPIDLYNERVDLTENASATVGLLGARNSVFLTLYRLRTEPLAAAAATLPPLDFAQSNNTQVGGQASWSYQLAPQTTLDLSGEARRTKANPPLDFRTDAWSLRAGVHRAVSPRTSVFGGARYQKSKTDAPGLGDYTETAVFAGFNHAFR